MMFTCLLASIAFDPPKPVAPAFKMDRKTTFITEPLLADGYPDYEAGINNHFRGRCQPNDNALILIWDMIGPKPEGGRTTSLDYWVCLGRKEPSESGEYFRSLSRYVGAARQQVNPNNCSNQWAEISQRREKLLRTPWKQPEAEIVAEWLKSEAERLKIMTKASHRPHFFNPFIARNNEGQRTMLMGSPLMHLSVMSEVASAFALRVTLQIGHGQTAEAWDDILTLYRLGRLIQRSSKTFEFNIGLQIEQLAIELTITFLEHTPKTKSILISYLRQLENLLSGGDLAHFVNWSGRLIPLDAASWSRRKGFMNVQGFVRAELLDNAKDYPGLNWNLALIRINEFNDKMVSFAEKPINERIAAWKSSDKEIQTRKEFIVKHEEKLRKDFENETFDAVSSECIGMQIAIMYSLCYPFEVMNEIQVLQYRQCISTAFALELYKAETNSYPPSLDVLTPQYLAAAPKDLVLNRPIHYERTAKGYFMAGVGMNEKLDKALLSEVTDTDVNRGDDIGIRIPRKK